jgi:hypothetical protein
MSRTQSYNTEIKNLFGDVNVRVEILEKSLKAIFD